MDTVTAIVTATALATGTHTGTVTHTATDRNTRSVKAAVPGVAVQKRSIKTTALKGRVGATPLP